MIDDCGPRFDGDWEMPLYAHIPGKTLRPVDGPIAVMVGEASERTEAASWQTNKPYLYGFVLYRGGFHWEAHEVWEAVWMRCRPNSSERFLLQALIQLSNAALKARMAKDRAVHRLLADAARLLDGAIGGAAIDSNQCVLMGVDLIRLQLLLRNHADAL